MTHVEQCGTRLCDGHTAIEPEESVLIGEAVHALATSRLGAVVSCVKCCELVRQAHRGLS